MWKVLVIGKVIATVLRNERVRSELATIIQLALSPSSNLLLSRLRGDLSAMERRVLERVQQLDERVNRLELAAGLPPVPPLPKEGA